MANSITIVALSGGKDSTAMSLRLAEQEPDNEYMYILTPTGNELPEMYDHWCLMKELLPGKFVPLVTETLDANIRRNGMIPNHRARFCTRQLKLAPYANFLTGLTEQYDEIISCVGIRADEEEREAGDYSDVPGVIERFPLREWGWKLADVQQYLAEKNIRIPRRTDCALCFWQRLGEWWDLWRDHPDEYEKGVQLEQEIGYTFRSNERDTWPASLEELRKEFERGRVPRGASVQGALFERDPIADMKCRVCRL